MLYCHHCGKKNEKGDSFCSNCGKRLAKLLEDIKDKVGDIKEEIEEKVEDIKGEAEEIVKKTSYKGLVIFIIILSIIGYIILNIWAISQLTPIISLSSIWASISNSNYDVSLTQTSASSTIRLENPTFVPVLFARIAYDANYGNNKVADGKTGFFIIGPYSQKDIPVDLTVYHLVGLGSGLKWIWNTITGQQERKYVNVYADVGITKFKVGTIE